MVARPIVIVVFVIAAALWPCNSLGFTLLTPDAAFPADQKLNPSGNDTVMVG
jgi:hypothetical protein